MSVTTTAFTEEQVELRETIRRFLEDRSPSSEVRRIMETPEGYDPVVWSQIAEIGLPGLIVPEEFGGFGGTFTDLAVVFEEMGRALYCGPYFSTVALAATLLLSLGDDEACADLLPSLASGETLATVAYDEGESGPVQATFSGGGFTLSGAKNYVVDGALADLILLPANTEDGVSVFAVSPDAVGIVRLPLEAMDMTRKLARIELSGAPARLIGSAGDALPALSRALDLAGVALAAEQVGGSRRCVEQSSDYARSRYQFDRAIGSFQAIKHRCVDMLVEVESARAAAYFAAAAFDEDATEATVAASLAQAVASETYFRVAAENIQVHGGVGFTWEHDAHLFFKRAKASELMLGDPLHHRKMLARRMGLGE
jgi:alkylation response protein AidB-like acyl-CoA dehydrogenase